MAKSITPDQTRPSRIKIIVALLLLAMFLVVAILAVRALNNTRKDSTGSDSSSKSEFAVLADHKRQEIEATKDPKAKALAYSEQANIFTASEDYQLAIDAYLQADKLQPNDPVIQGNIGRMYFKLKNGEQSKKYFQKAISLIEADQASPYKSNLPLYKSYLNLIEKGDFNEAKGEGEN